MATFGKTTIGGTTDQWIKGDDAGACKFVLGENGSVTSMKIYMYSYGGNIRLGIYDHDAANNRPNNLKGTTTARFITSTAYAWETFNFPAPIDLTAGTYWLACQSDTDLYSAYDAGAAEQSGYHADAYADGFLDPWGAAITRRDREWSIYATYTPVAPPVGGHHQPYFVLTLP